MIKLVEKDGKLATMYQTNDHDEPFLVTVYHVSTIPVSEYPGLVGASLYSSSRGANFFRADPPNGGESRIVDTEGWETVIEQTPLKPPGRGGKYWRWVYERGEWRKTFR